MAYKLKKQDKKGEKQEKIKWGFDLTEFKSAENFKELIKKYGLKYKKEPEYSDGKLLYNKFVWYNPKVKIITGNNPLTGEYSTPKAREKEKGYASYIGIEGDKDLVLQIVKDIKNNTKYIKDESPLERRYI